MDKEIERLNNDYLEMKDNFRVANDEIERLQDRIDKAIEYLDAIKGKDFSTRSQYGYILVDYNRLVSILMGKPRFTNEKGKQ